MKKLDSEFFTVKCSFEAAAKNGDIGELEALCGEYLRQYPGVLQDTLAVAIWHKRAQFLEFVLDRHLDILPADGLRRDFDGAVNSKRRAMAIMLIKTGKIQLDEPDPYNGLTCLMLAAKVGLDDVVKFLLDYGVSVNTQSPTVSRLAGRTGMSALMLAAERNRLTIAESLLRHAADVNAVSEEGRTALDYTGRSSKREGMRMLLIKAGAMSGKELLRD